MNSSTGTYTLQLFVNLCSTAVVDLQYLDQYLINFMIDQYVELIDHHRQCPVSCTAVHTDHDTDTRTSTPSIAAGRRGPRARTTCRNFLT